MSLTRLRRVALASLAVASIVSAGAAGTASAAGAFTFVTTIDRPCVYVNGGLANTFTDFRQQSSTGTVLEYRRVTSDADGTAGVCFANEMLIGMQVRVTQNATTRTFTMPKATMKVDRTTDIVSGIAPKGLQVELQVIHAYGFGAGATTTLYRTASSAGTYGADFTSKVNIAGGDRLGVIVRYPNGDAVDLVGYVPQAVVRIGQPGFLASFASAQSGYVTLKNAAGTVRARGYVHEDVNSQYDAGRFTSNGISVAPRIGDSVSASFGIPSFVIPAIGLGFNLGTSTVAGSCPKSRPLSIQVVDSADSQVYDGLATCSAAGTYSVTTAPTRTLVNGDRVVVAARLPGGDIVSRQRIVVP